MSEIIPGDIINPQIEEIRQRFNKVIKGQPDFVDGMLIGLLTGSHILVEGVPGLGKTWGVRLLSQLLATEFRRIQFTPDLMPADVIGSSVYLSGNSRFEFRPGPVFGNLVLIDEINRAPAKTQSALFEVMEERQVTVDGISHSIKSPFLIVATQNPVDHEGTYRLPEAELDRFLLKIILSYPSEQAELEILNENQTGTIRDQVSQIRPVIEESGIVQLMNDFLKVKISQEILEYLNKVSRATRNYRDIYLGVSPRAGIALLNAARAFAFINGRSFITPDDVKTMVLPVFRHRLVLTAEAELEGKTPDKVLSDLLTTVSVPR